MNIEFLPTLKHLTESQAKTYLQIAIHSQLKLK